MNTTRRSLYYLAGYLIVGGIGFTAVPSLMLTLFLSTGSYDQVMIRFVGVLLLVLGIIISQVIRYRIEVLYPVTLVARAIILGALLWFYFLSFDPLMIVLMVIVGIGFLLTLSGYLIDRRNASRLRV
ncbi:MAG: hypothetical protein OEM41_10970 [Ignavibacteria bacterium]|nr:hypothetical protein [Ignavibacteria bacterium]